MATAANTVREVVLANPAATRVFEELGIDYCCGGEKPLQEACTAARRGIDEVLARLEALQNGPLDVQEKDWQREPLTALAEHIVATHHAFVRSECPRIAALLNKVCGVHGANHPELLRVRDVFAGLTEELSAHLLKEEQVLFPYIVSAEKQAGHGLAAPASCFGTVRNPIHMMMLEHDNAGNALRELRRLTNDYALPGEACVSYRTLFEALQAFEADLHRHIHLENNILFPRAIDLEQAGH
jgi:regulator of cell morphogenesis and NO signaling